MIIKIIKIITIITFLKYCDKDPIINFPAIIEPNYITYKSNLEEDNIKSIIKNKLKSKIKPFKKSVEKLITIKGIVINSYNSKIKRLKKSGFFIQDQGAAIFIKSNKTKKIIVKRGDLLEISKVKIQKIKHKIQATITKKSTIKILSKNNKILTTKENTYKNLNTKYIIPKFIKLKGLVKSNKNNNIIIYSQNKKEILIKTISKTKISFPNIYPKDKILAYGVINSNKNEKLELWIYDSTNAIIDLTVN